jgi:hypothetical protein
MNALSVINEPLESINLPRYRCKCQGHSHPLYLCPHCVGSLGTISYKKSLEIWGFPPTLSMQIPQCHICSRFQTDDNPIFAYSYLEKNNEYKFIYRCKKGHGHDRGITLIDLHTNLEVHL